MGEAHEQLHMLAKLIRQLQPSNGIEIDVKVRSKDATAAKGM